MLNPKLLDVLVCPENRSRLEIADESLVERLNRASVEGGLVNRGGQKIVGRLDGALVRADKSVAYPIIDGIPIMLVDEGILLDGETS